MMFAAWTLLKKTAEEWVDDNAPTYAASLAYYTVFSIAPTLVIAVAIAGAIFDTEAARAAIQNEIRGPLGEQGARALTDMVDNAARWHSGGWATAIGLTVLIFGATGVFAELQTALNAIWNVKPQITGVKAFFRTRFLSFAMVLGIGFLLLVSLVLSAVLAAVEHWAGTYTGNWALVGRAINFMLSIGVVTLVIAMIYKVLPDTKVEWRDVWLGAVATAVMFNLGKYAIAVYLGQTALASSYGAAGSLAALLVWVYYSSMILLFGAEFTQVFARTHGSWREFTPSNSPQATMTGERGAFGPPSTRVASRRVVPESLH